MDELSEPERLQLLHEEGQYDAFRHIDPVAAMMLEAPLSYLKSGLKQMLSQSIPENFRQLVVAHLQELGDAEAPKAPETRSAFDKKFKAEFGAKLKRSGFGTWHLPVRTCETDIKIEMDFGGFGPGFRYELLVAIPGPRHPARFSYEGMLGFLAHDWNLLRTDRLEEHADLLVHLVRLALDALASIEFERLVASRLANHQRE